MAVSVLHYLRTDHDRFEKRRWLGEDKDHSNQENFTRTRTPCAALPLSKKTQCFVARQMLHAVKLGGYVWIMHNGCYKGKWDPKRVWGPDYWRCCFGPELARAEVSLNEVPEADI